MRKLMLLVSMLLIIVSSHALADENSWYYSRDEVDKLYEIHYNSGDRIDNYIHELKDGKYVAELQYGKRIMVPAEFIQHILWHLESALEKGWVNYIFWPDLHHGHLFVPVALWNAKYSGSGESFEDQITRLLRENIDKLGILYHAAEHFGHYDPANTEAVKTRNVVGWFDGRPIELTYPDPKEAKSAHIEANTAGDPKGYDRRWFISISASKYGYFSIYPNGREVKFDISFDERDIYSSTTYPRKQPKYSDDYL